MMMMINFVCKGSAFMYVYTFVHAMPPETRGGWMNPLGL